MNSSKSSLNPNATPYVPLYKTSSGLGFNEEDDSKGTTPIGIGSCENIKLQQIPDADFMESNTHGFQSMHVSEKAPVIIEDYCDPYKQHGSEDVLTETNKQSLIEDFKVAEDFLMKAFPGFSSECLAVVYYMNGGDLEGTMSWLEQAEFPSNNFDHDAGTSDVAETSNGRYTSDVSEGGGTETE